MEYELKDDVDTKGMILGIQKLLDQLSNIDVDALTTFELNFIRTFASKPPNKYKGVDTDQ